MGRFDLTEIRYYMAAKSGHIVKSDLAASDPAISNRDIGLVSKSHVWAHVTTKAGTSAMGYHMFVEHVLNTYNVVANWALHWT